MEIFTNLFDQLIFTVGIVALFGFLIALMRKLFIGCAGTLGYYILLIMGIVGTPVHELSHALMCLIFGHEVTEVKLYDPTASDGTLGYVNHSYNPKSIYQQIGNFFIGIAPIICGSGVILLLMMLLVPDTFGAVTQTMSGFATSGGDVGYIDYFIEIVTDVFNTSNFNDFAWWIFLVLALMISSHMELSFADIKGGALGFLFIVILLLVVDVVLFFAFPEALFGLTAVMTSFAASIVGFLGVSFVFLAVMVAVAFAFKLIF